MLAARSLRWGGICPIAFLWSLFTCAVALYNPEKKLETARLYGNLDGYAYYFVDLIVGTPPQRVSVILDTGSGMCGFPCKSCAHCGKHIDPAFDYGASSSAEWVPCGSKCTASHSCLNKKCSYRKSYLEGSSIDGVVFEDYVSIGDAIQSNPPVRAQLGCHQHENKLFYTQKANGIFGIQGPTSLLHSFFKDGSHVDTSVFTICLSKEGGRLTVGGADTTDHHGTVSWMKFPGQKYTVPLKNMEVGGKLISGFASTLLDSGTTFTYFPDQHYRSLRDGIDKYCKAHRKCGTLRGTCYSGLAKPYDLSGFPIVKVKFDGITIDWHPSEYLHLKRSSSKDSSWCFAFENDGRISTTTLGASFMLNKDVIFDLGRKLIGMAPARCPEYKGSKRPPPPQGHSWEEIMEEAKHEAEQELLLRGNTSNQTALLSAEKSFLQAMSNDTRTQRGPRPLSYPGWSFNDPANPRPWNILLTVTVVLAGGICLKCAISIIVGKRMRHTQLPSEEHDDFGPNPNIVGMATEVDDDEDGLRF